LSYVPTTSIWHKSGRRRRKPAPSTPEARAAAPESRAAGRLAHSRLRAERTAVGAAQRTAVGERMRAD
jgi:hypothetical protein